MAVKTSSNSTKLFATAKKYLWPTFGRDASFFGKPVSIVKSAQGRHIVDSFGNRLLETNSSGGAAPLGYNVPELTEAMISQMQNISNTTPSLFVPTEPVVWLAEKIASLSPGALQYTIFSSNGTDANDAAMKIARHYWKIIGKGSKYKIISRFPRGWHGMSLSGAAASSHTFRRYPWEPLPAGFIQIHAPICYRCPYNLASPKCGLQCGQELRRVIEYEDPSTVACFILEQTIGGGGIIPPPQGYMKMVREICDEYDVLLITDEVITGFGKTGFWFECEKYNIVPDIVTMGKGLSWGCGPLSGTHVTGQIAEVFKGEHTLRHGYTFGGMGYLAAAGLAGIEYVERHKLLARVIEIEHCLSSKLSDLGNVSPIVGEVRVNGVLAGIELVKDKRTRECFEDRSAVANLVRQVGIDNGVLLACSPWYGDIIILMIPLTMTDEELDITFNATSKAINAVWEQFI
jgi:adenosylmethionine-8-amino-7-oxononanoate aminotransferase